MTKSGIGLKFRRLSGLSWPGPLAAAVVALACPAEARAELQMCNQTLNLYNVAVGYFTGAGCDERHLDKMNCFLKTTGWWNLPANGCVSVFKWDLENKYYYVFATDIYGEDAVTGKTELCVKINSKFEIEIPFSDAEAKAPGCWQKGYQQVQFKEIDVGSAKDWTVFMGQ